MAQALSPEQVRLVLRRAAELERRADATPDVVGEEDVAEIAAEIGIAPEAVRTALAEVRAGVVGAPEAAPTLTDRLVGRGELTVSRTVPGPIPAVRAEVERFLKAQLLEMRRNHGDRGQVWGPAWDLWSRIRRAFDITQEVALEKGSEVHVQLVPQPDEQVLVRLTARLVESRKKRLTRVIGATVAGAGVAAGGIALFTTAPAEAISVLAGGGIAAGTLLGARSAQRREIDKADAALERFLDRLEHER